VNINWLTRTPAGPDSTTLIPTYGNYGGYNYTGGKIGGDQSDVPPQDELDALFKKHDDDYRVANSPQDTINADKALIEGILKLPASALNDPEAKAYANATLVAFLRKLGETPGGGNSFPSGEATKIVEDAIRDFFEGVKKGGLPVGLGLSQWFLESVAQKLIILGIENFDFDRFYPDFVRPILPPWLGPILDPLFRIPGLSPSIGGAGLGGCDPLVLDLNGDGKISLTNVENGVQFDYLRDGYAERNAWVKPQDGLLVLDKNKNGIIEGFSEMVASPRPLSFLQEGQEENFSNENGFAKLSLLDGNKDDVIDSKDAVFKTLRVWQDRNQDGISQKNELKSLSQLKIASIDYGNAELINYIGIRNGGFSRTDEGNIISHQSTYTLTNGQVRTIVDAWLDHDLANSVFEGDRRIDPNVLFLPNLRGYGTLPDLHLAMSKDKALFRMVESFEAKYRVDNFATKANTARADFEKILMKWAGVTPDPNPTPTELSHTGVFEYMPEYEFLKKLTGTNNKIAGPWFDERPFHPILQEGIPGIQNAFDAYVDGALFRVLMQSAETSLFATTPAYLAFKGDFSTDLKLSKLGINKLQTGAKAVSDKLGYWHNVATLLDSAIGIEKLTATELSWLNSAIKASSGSALDWQDVKVTLGQNSISTLETTPEVFGSKYDDRIVAVDYDTSQPSGITYQLHGGAGDDVLVGGDGNSFLSGGAGNDILYAGAGNTTYYYSSGHDVIDTSSANYQTDINTIQFAPSIKPSDIQIKILRPASGSTWPQKVIVVEGKGTISRASELLGDYGPIDQQIDQLRFSDGTVMKLSEFVPTYVGSDQSDQMDVGIDNWSKNALLYGMGGNDQLSGSGLKDVTETFYGGSGNDVLNGFGGNDRYVYQSGRDTIYEAEDKGTDSIIFEKGVKTDQVALQRVTSNGQITDDLRIAILGKGTILIEDAFLQANVEKIKFASGQTFDLPSLLKNNRVEGSLGDDQLVGRDKSPIFLQDHLIGNDGNDRLEGKKGNDILEGGAGNDRYIVGDGLDIIYDISGTDSIVFGSQFDLSKFTFKFPVNTSQLDILYDGVTKVRVLGQFAIPIEKIVVAGKGSIDLTKVVFDQIGTDGADYIVGITYGGSVNNRILGKGGGDSIYADIGNDYVDGGAGNDTLNGWNGDDTLIGGTGDDLLEGGAGADKLYGGKGADNFALQNFAELSEVDVIFDFSLLEKDKIDFTRVTSGIASAAISNYVDIRQSGADSIVGFDSSGLGSDFVDVAVLKNTTGLTDANKLYADGLLLLG
jgi:Ca2+-binding RTX toxin-like protein